MTPYPHSSGAGSEVARPRVMICDDEVFAVEALADALRAENVDVELTERPQDCLAAGRKERFDLFILDMDFGAEATDILPDGLALARAIWAQASPVNVPIVGITGVRSDWKERGLALGLVNFFDKPFPPSRIVADILNLLESRNEARQAMETWLEQTAGPLWHVVDLSAADSGALKLQSSLVFGEGFLSREGPEVRLCQRLLHMGMIEVTLFEELGARLHECLLPNPLNVGFHQHRLLSQLAEKPFRLLLRIGDSECQHLPWEFCRYRTGTDSGYWLGGDPQLTCARVAPNSGRLLSDEVLPKPLRILVVGASPPELPRLNLRKELRALREAMSPLGDEVEWRSLVPSEKDGDDEATPEWVKEQIRNFKPHVVHFMCHGEAEALIVERHGRMARWSDYFLSLDLSHQGVKLLVLNCCLSAHPGNRSPGIALGTLSAGVPTVIGHFFPVSDPAAIRFTHLLYSGWVGGEPLDVALQEARRQVWSQELQQGRPFLPVLFVRDRFFRLPSGGEGGAAGVARAT